MMFKIVIRCKVATRSQCVLTFRNARPWGTGLKGVASDAVCGRVQAVAASVNLDGDAFRQPVGTWRGALGLFVREGRGRPTANAVNALSLDAPGYPGYPRCRHD